MQGYSKHFLHSLALQFSRNKPKREETQKPLKMDIQEEFEQYAEGVRQLSEADIEKYGVDALPSDEDKLLLYGLFKQATVGPVNIPRPNKFNMIGRYKWDAWKAIEDKPKEEAMKEYIAKVKELMAAAGYPLSS